MKAFIRTAKAFFYKEDFDWDGEITFQNFHPQMLIFLAVNGVFFNNKESKIRFIFPVFSTLITLVAVVLETFFIWHGISIKDYSFATECFCYLFILSSVGLIYSSVLLNREKVFKLVHNMNSDFLFICKLKPEYRKTFLSGQQLIWQLCWLWMVFICFVAVLYISNTLLYLLYQSTLATQDEHVVRPLIFPVWLPEDDPYRTPNYEVFMVLEIILIFVMVLTFGVYVYILFHLLLHSYNLLDIIIIMMAVDELFIGTVRDDSATSVADISSVFGPMLVYQMMFSSIVICLMAYQVAEQLSERKIDYLFGLMGIGACLQLWIQCYIGTLMRNKGFLVGDRCFYCGWHKTPLSRLLRQDLIIIIQRTQRPVAIKFPGLPHLQLETFSSIISNAYSLFNMLRQYN